jgi:hypothetical protein
VANDILNAILPADKAGLYWALATDGATDSAATIFAANGSPGVSPLLITSTVGNNNFSAINVIAGGLSAPTGDFSFVTVMNVTNFGNPNYLWVKWNVHGSTYCWAVYTDVTTGVVNFIVADSTGATATAAGPALTAGTWVVVGCTYTSASKALKMRVNGVNYTATGSHTGVSAATTASYCGDYTAFFRSYGGFFTEKVLSDADIDRIGAMGVTPVVSSNWLKLNGIETSGIASAPDNVTGTRREAGERTPATDLTTRLTVQTMKRDLTFKTVALTAADAFSWEMFIRGEGHVWQFEDFGLYSSKGGVPQDTTGCSIVTGSAKFGSKKLRIASGQFQTDIDALTNLFGYYGDYTVMFWKSTDSGATWHHYVLRSDGSKWVDGVSSGASFAAFLTIGGSGDVTLSSNADFDDFVCLPFKVLDTWPALFFARTAAYPNTPFLEAAGAMVPEQATRLVAGDATETTFKSAASKTNMRLSVTLTAR